MLPVKIENRSGSVNLFTIKLYIIKKYLPLKAQIGMFNVTVYQK